MLTIKQVLLYSDGACSGNPGPGGYGAILIKEGNKTSFAKGFVKTTNNRMELLGIIEPLETLYDNYNIIITTDSKYVSDAINQGWLKKWIKNDWITSNDKPVKNQDLWNRLIHILNKHDITIKWVKGHDGNSENEECDELAVEARKSGNLYVDENFKEY